MVIDINYMRPKERIKIFLDLIDWEVLAERWDIDKHLINAILDSKGKLSKSLTTHWLKEYDLRFGQMLINFQFVPDKLKIWCDEEDNILADQGIPKREFMLWGRNDDKDGNQLPNIERILIKDMTTDHIEAILRDIANHRMNIRNDYKELFEEELKLRT